MADKFSINLLPPEIILLEKQAKKLNWANKFSVAMLLILVMLTSATLGIRLIQNSAIKEDDQGIVHAQSKISSFKDKEATAVLLKKRVDSIEGLLADNRKSEMFTAIVNLAPADTQLALVSVEKSGAMLVSATVSSIASLDDFLTTLRDKEITGDFVNKIDLENLTKSRDGLYRYDLKITPKQ